MSKIELKERKPTFDYILNDLALSNLVFNVVNGIASSQDKFDFEYQVKLMEKELSRLKSQLQLKEAELEERKKEIIGQDKYIDKLKKEYDNQLQQKENIIKEAINYIKEESWFCYKDNEEIIDRTLVNKLLEILENSNE